MLGIFADPSNNTDSPDLGPPPIAHFDEGDPIKFDTTQEPSPRKESTEAPDEMQPKLLANLETRKKRRESSHGRDVGVKSTTNMNSTKYAAPTTTAMLPNQPPVKSGSKRKLIACDEDNQATMADESGKQDFQSGARDSDLRMSDVGTTQPIVNDAARATGRKIREAAMASNGGRDGRERASRASATVTAAGRKPLGPSMCCKRSLYKQLLTILQKV